MSWLLVGTIFLAMIVWRVLLKLWPRDPSWSGIVASGIVIASSTYSLFTDPPESLSFRLHAALLVAMLVVAGFHVRRLRTRST